MTNHAVPGFSRGQFLAPADERGATLGAVAAATLELRVAPLEFGQIDKYRLVEIEEPGVLGVRPRRVGGEPSQFA